MMEAITYNYLLILIHVEPSVPLQISQRAEQKSSFIRKKPITVTCLAVRKMETTKTIKIFPFLVTPNYQEFD